MWLTLTQELRTPTKVRTDRPENEIGFSTESSLENLSLLFQLMVSAISEDCSALLLFIVLKKQWPAKTLVIYILRKLKEQSIHMSISNL